MNEYEIAVRQLEDENSSVTKLWKELAIARRKEVDALKEGFRYRNTLPGFWKRLFHWGSVVIKWKD